LPHLLCPHSGFVDPLWVFFPPLSLEPSFQIPGVHGGLVPPESWIVWCWILMRLNALFSLSFMNFDSFSKFWLWSKTLIG
jgi:hypothetical protein